MGRGHAGYRCNSEGGRHLIEGAVQQLGVEQRRRTAEKLGLFAAIVAIAAAVVGVLALLGVL